MKLSHKFAFLACLLTFSAICPCAYAIPSGFNIVEVANISNLPAYKFYDWAAMNESGHVCFKASSETASAIVGGNENQRTVLASTNDGTGLFEQFATGICSINDNGDVAFDACRNCETTPAYGVYRRNLSGPLAIVQETSSGADDFNFVSLPSINLAGDISFSGKLNNGLQGIWIKNGAQQALKPFDSSGFLSELGGAFMNDAQQITFGGIEDGTPEVSGIYGPIANRIIGTFNNFAKESLPVINNNGAIALTAISFPQSDGSTQSGVFLNGNPFVLNTGDFAQVDINPFQGVSLNDRGDIVFPAIRPNGNQVAFIAVQGGILPLIEKGDLIPGHSSPVALANVSREAINNSRQIAMIVVLQDKTELVVRLDPVNVVFPDDHCPTDNAKFEPGICGCGISDADNNSDGIPNCLVTGTLNAKLTNLSTYLKKVKRLPSNASKKAKKAQSANIKLVKQALNEMFALAQSSSAEVKLLQNKQSAAQLSKAVKTQVKKALQVKLSTFKVNMKSALTSINKFIKVLKLT